MSRGLGKIQRACLEVLARDRKAILDSIEVAGLVVGRMTITESEHVSVRRALRALAKAGLVVDMQRAGWRNNRRHWALSVTGAKFNARTAAVF